MAFKYINVNQFKSILPQEAVNVFFISSTNVINPQEEVIVGPTEQQK